MHEYKDGDKVIVHNPMHPSEAGYTGVIVQRVLRHPAMYEVMMDSGPYQGISEVYYLESSLAPRP